jgi:asparaginyl-tRNA synthetase
VILPGNYVRDLLGRAPGTPATARGWVKTRRDGKNVHFIQLNDGSSAIDLQVVVDEGLVAPEVIARVTTGASLSVDGELVASPGKGQAVELKARSLVVHGTADPEEYPLQKKKHNLETLRPLGHLRARTNTFGAVFRVRNALARAIHRFFEERGFLFIQAPVISSSDAEGAGSFQTAKPPLPITANAGGNTEQIATVLFSQYLLPFEIASVLLLVAVVGSVVMAKKRI